MKSFSCPAILMMAYGASANYGKYVSGEVKTYETFTYGRFTTSMKGPNKPGTCFAFFTFFNDYPKRVEGYWNEIDVEIVPSMTKHPFSTNIIW